MPQPPPSGSHAKVEGRDKNDIQKPSDQFRSLARRLVRVTPDELCEQQKKYDSERSRKSDSPSDS